MVKGKKWSTDAFYTHKPRVVSAKECAKLCAKWDGKGSNKKICQYWEWYHDRKTCVFKKCVSSREPRKQGSFMSRRVVTGICPQPRGPGVFCRNGVAYGEKLALVNSLRHLALVKPAQNMQNMFLSS